MKKNFQRAAAFIMAVIMVLTMSNWSGLATTVAKAAETVTVYFYNYNQGTKPLSGTITVSVNSNGVQSQATMSTGRAPEGASTTANWYSADVAVENKGAVSFSFTGADSGSVSIGAIGLSGNIAIISPTGANYTDITITDFEAAFGTEGVTSTRIYFYDGTNWAATGAIKVVSWGSWTWPGDDAAAATELGEGWYYKDVPSTDSTIIFHNNTSSGTFHQTKDVSVTAGQVQYIVYTSDDAPDSEKPQFGTCTLYTDKTAALEAAAAIGRSSGTYNVHVYDPNHQWDNAYAYYWGDGINATGISGTKSGNWYEFTGIPKAAWAFEFGKDGSDYDSTKKLYYPNLGWNDYYFYVGQDNTPGTAEEHGYATAAKAIIASGATARVYFYQEETWENAGIAYHVDGTEYFTPPAAAVEGCPGWYLAEVPAAATDLKVVQVKLSSDGLSYEWGGAAGRRVDGVPNGSADDVAIRQNDGVAYTVASLAAALGQSAGYPGNPYPATMDVWYYNPDWTGSSVYINYRSDITGWNAGDCAPAVKMTETGLAGWFFIDGETAAIYKARVGAGEVSSNAVQIFFTKDGGDQNGASAFSDHYVCNKDISADGNREDFNKDADVLYLMDVNDSPDTQIGRCYPTAAALAAAAGITDTPDSDTKIYIYRNNLELKGGYALNAADNSIEYTTSWDASAASWYVLTVKGVNAAAYPMSYGFGNWGISPTWESGSLYANTREVYINGDTGITYTSKQALEDGLTSTFYIYCPDGKPVGVTATHKIVDNSRNYMATVDSVDSITLEAAAGKGAGWYKGEVKTDAVEVGYKLTYTYNGKTYNTGVRIEDAEIDGATGIVKDTLRAYYYAGTDSDGIDAANKTRWTSVYADVFYYKKGTTEKVTVLTDEECLSDGDGWFYIDTCLSALDPRFENGIYVQFKSAEGITSGSGFEHTVTESGTITAAYQFLNNYRAYGTSQMSMFKSKSAAIQALKNTETANDIPTDKTRVWFYFPGGWADYYVFYSTAEGGANPADQAYEGNYSQMVKQEAYADELGGGWYYADVPSGANYIYFDEDNTYGNGGNISQKYDISGKTSNEIFCVVNDSVIPKGWSTSTAEIAKVYGLTNVPASNEISMPVTILDYNADNLFFEYDMYYLRNMTLVLGNQGGWYGMAGMGISAESDLTVPWPTIDIEGVRPGDAPHYDRNGKEYVSGVLEDTLVNGYPVYTEQAVTYVAKVVERGMLYYAKDKEKEPDAIQSYNKTALFDTIYKNITGDTELNGTSSLTACTNWHVAYEASKAKYTGAGFKLSEYDITKDTSLTCMDYAYYVLNNLYDTNSNYNKDYGMYSYLVLKRTSPNVYGFYANFETNLPTAYNLPQNYEIIYAPSLEEGKGTIFNNVNDATTLYVDKQGMKPTGTDEGGNTTYTRVEGYAGMFPYNLPLIEAMYGAGTNEKTDAPKSKDEGHKNQDGYAQAETNFYRYRDYVMNGQTVTVEYIDSAAYSVAVGADMADNQYTTEYRNCNYALKLSGKFRFDYNEDLYFTFTGDDDVVLYISGKKVLDLSGAHQAASYTVYLSDLVDDGIVPMTDGAYYDLDFFYMERHTTWSNMRIETNIDVIDVSGQVQKHAYDKDGNVIGSGSVVDTNAEVTFEYELNAESGDGLVNLAFEDPTLGISISPESIVLGSYVDAKGNTVDRKVGDLKVAVGSTVYTNLTEDELKSILQTGINAGERILISNIKHVMTSGVDAPVTATMNGETDGRALSSVAKHRLFIGDPSISVTKTASNAAGTNLPNNTVVQSGTVADYTITLTNTGGLPLHNLTLQDEELGINFSVAADGTVTAQYNRAHEQNTKVTDLVFTVRGTGISDGIYTISATKEDSTAKTTEELETELKNLISKLTQIVYPTGASLSVSGIKHPITETYTSTSVGTADSLQNYEGAEEKGWEQYGKAYMAYLTSGTGTEPDYKDYVTVTGKETICETYAAAYKAYVKQVKENGLLNADVPDPVDSGFTEDEQVTDNAVLTLNAKLSAYNYYTQAGQTIDIRLQDEVNVSLPTVGTWGQSATAGTAVVDGQFELTAGAHTVTIYKNNDGFNGFEVYEITLTNVADPAIRYTLTVDNAAENGTTASKVGDGFSLPNIGNAAVYAAQIDVAGTYTATVKYVNAEEDTKTGTLVFDYLPGDYILTDEEGNPITTFTGEQKHEATYTVGNATIVVNNDNAYPAIQYTYADGNSGRVVVGVADPDAGAGVTPDTITVTSYDVSDNVYVLDYGLKVDLTDEKWNNGLFQNDQIDALPGDIATIVGLKGIGTKLDTKADDYVYKYADGTYTSYAIGQYGAVSANGANAASADVTYELNKFLEGVDRYLYGVQVGLRNSAVKDVTNSTPVMEANVTIMPATVVYYEDNFASVITNGTVIGGEEEVEISDKVWTTTWEDGNTHDQADYGLDLRGGATSIVSDVEAHWIAYTLGANIVPDAVNDIYYKLTSFVDPDGNTQNSGNIFKYLDPQKQYVLRFKVINNAGERNFAIGAGIDAEGYVPDESLFYTTFRAGGNGAQTTDIEIPIENVGEVDGRTLVLYLGPTSDDPNAYTISSFYIADVEVVEKAEATDMQSNSLKTQYGYDPVYADDNTYSNNGYTALSGTDKFAFTFKGTGFDILTRTANAGLKVSVYDASQFELKSYTYTSGGVDKVAITVVKKSAAPEDAAALKSLMINAGYENGTLDQVPLISVDMEAYGNYIVLAQRTGSEDLHVDGIRIYNPLGQITDDEVKDAYGNAAGEEGATIREIRNMIFGEGYTFDFTNPADPSTAQIAEGKGAVAGLVQMVGEQLNITTGSTVVECYTGAFNSSEIASAKADNPVDTSSLLGYAVSGANNELYLTGAEYAFGAVINGITGSSMLQIGLKAIGGSAAVQYRALDGTWKDIPDAGNLTASIEMYYKLDTADLWKVNDRSVLLVRVSSGTASLTNLKYNGITFEKITPAALGAVVTEDADSSSFNIISSGTAGTKAVITFSVSSEVKDFTISNANSKDKVFTYGTKEALPEGISVSKRESGDLNIYVVKMPKTAGTYTITTSTGETYGTAEFTIQ